MVDLSVEAIIAVISVVVGLPPTILVLAHYIKRRGRRHLHRAIDEESPAHSNTLTRPFHSIYEPSIHMIPQRHLPLHRSSQEYFHAMHGTPRIAAAYDITYEQHSFSQATTYRRSTPYPPP